MEKYMKKIALITALLLASTSAFADRDDYHRGYENHYHHTHGGNGFGGFIGPALIGGIIGYEIGRPAQPTVIYPAPPPVVYQQAQPVYVYPTNVPVPTGMYCELRSINYNGQIVTNNYCHY